MVEARFPVWVMDTCAPGVLLAEDPILMQTREAPNHHDGQESCQVSVKQGSKQMDSQFGQHGFSGRRVPNDIRNPYEEGRGYGPTRF